jgi:hypothetical protein
MGFNTADLGLAHPLHREWMAWGGKMVLKYEALRIFLAVTGILMTAMLTNSQPSDFDKQEKADTAVYHPVSHPNTKRLKHPTSGNLLVASYHYHARK